MPACADANLKIWNRIPDGAHLELQVVGHDDRTEDQFVAQARLITTDGDEENWTDDQIRGRTKRKQLRSPKGYDVRVRIAFSRSDSAQIQAKVIKPDGSVHAKPYCHAVAGSAGDIHRATVIAITIRS